jgi:hypothetical protein
MRLSDETIDEIQKGYVQKDDFYQCLFCDEKFECGKIYQINDECFDAYGAMKRHIKDKHGSSCDCLFSQNALTFGLSEGQMKVLKGIWLGKDDKEIATELKISPSTVRNYKFKFREKYRQAKVFMALFDEIQTKIENPVQQEYPVIHDSSTMIDDRYNTTDEECKIIKETYFNTDGTLKSLPSKQKKKLVLLQEISKQFTSGKDYSEKEVNEILKKIFDDFVTLRRDLIEYGFLVRSNDGKIYRIKTKKVI